MVDFQINGETYFIDLAEDARQWQVFVSTPDGPREVPVYDDGAEFDDDVPVMVEDKRRRRILN
jgi:hypothetical protein